MCVTHLRFFIGANGACPRVLLESNGVFSFEKGSKIIVRSNDERILRKFIVVCLPLGRSFNDVCYYLTLANPRYIFEGTEIKNIVKEVGA